MRELGFPEHAQEEAVSGDPMFILNIRRRPPCQTLAGIAALGGTDRKSDILDVDNGVERLASSVSRKPSTPADPCCHDRDRL